MRRFALRVAALVAVFLLLLLVVQVWTTQRLARSFAERIADMTARGLLPGPEVVPEDELASFRQRIARLETLASGAPIPISDGHPFGVPDGDAIALLDRTLADPAIVRVLTGRARLGERARLESLERIVDALGLRAVWFSQPKWNGAGAESAGWSLAVAFDLVRVTDGGFEIPYVHSVALERKLLKVSLRDAWPLGGFDAAGVASSLDETLALSASRERVEAALREEWMRYFGPDGLPLDYERSRWAVFSRGGALERAVAAADFFATAVAALDVPCDSLERPARDRNGWLDHGYGLDHGFAFVFQIGGMAQVEAASHHSRRILELARIALALAAHDAEHGAWPDTLDELGGRFPNGVPLDPCTRRPFVYVVGAATVEVSCKDLSSLGPPHTPASSVWSFPR